LKDRVIWTRSNPFKSNQQKSLKELEESRLIAKKLNNELESLNTISKDLKNEFSTSKKDNKSWTPTQIWRGC
jgi:hypothetical protein